MGFLDYGHKAKSFAEMLKGGSRVPVLPTPPGPITAVVVPAGISGYTYAVDEVHDALNQRWTPSSWDFFASAAAAKWPNMKTVAAYSATDCFFHLRTLTGKIARIVFMGYDERIYLTLSAMRHRPLRSTAVALQLPALMVLPVLYIDAAELRKAKVSLGVIRRKLVPGAELNIITHNGSLDISFAQVLADAFGVPVHYCSYPVLWQLGYNLASSSVTRRGQINVQPVPNSPPYTVVGAHVISFDQSVNPTPKRQP